MATLAAIFDKFTLAWGAAPMPARTRETADDSLIRAIPNETIYHFVKRIDNSMVEREPDPGVGRTCWKVIGTGVAGTIVLVCLLLPSVYGLLAGYQLQTLRQEKRQLEISQAALTLEETRLLSPEELDKVARKEQFTNPAPGRLVYLESGDGSRLARNNAAPAAARTAP